MPHPYELPAEFVARAESREGRVHTIVDLTPATTALIVVDMQRYFIEESFAGACPVAQQIVPNVNRLAGELRSRGGLVVWLQMLANPLSDVGWTSLRERYSEASARGRWDNLQAGAAGFELWPELDVREPDLRVIKKRYSAFITGSSELDDLLRRRGVDTLLVVGVATNACCESTARDAMMIDYRVLMVSDACAAATDGEHAAALNNFYLFFGDVHTTDEVLTLLGR